MSVSPADLKLLSTALVNRHKLQTGKPRQKQFCVALHNKTDFMLAITTAVVCSVSWLQAKELKVLIKKQNTQRRQLEAAAKDAEQTAQTAQQQYKEHLQELQSQLDQAQTTNTVPPSGPPEAEAALHAELQSLQCQLAEAQQEVTSMQQQQAKGGSASVLPSTNPSTPSKSSAASPAQDSAAHDSAAQDLSAASAEKESAKDKDTQLQVVSRL